LAFEEKSKKTPMIRLKWIASAIPADLSFSSRHLLVEIAEAILLSLIIGTISNFLL